MTHLDVDLPWGAFLQRQWDLFAWDPPAGTKQAVEGLLGGWGSGKTEGGARLFVKRVAGNGWRPDYGRKNPVSYVCSPTWRVMRQTTLPMLEAAMPRELIRRQRTTPIYEWELVNNHRILFVSAESEIEGFSACVGWCDEIQHHNYWSSPKRFPNLTARVREPKASLRSLIVTGLPEAGPVRDKFDKPDNPRYHVLLTGTRDNVYLDEETIEVLLASCPAGYEDAFIGGRWLMPAGAIYSQYDAARHLTDKRGDPHAATHLGLDVGNGGAVIFAQDELVDLHNGQKGASLIVVDELLAANMSVEEICLRVRDHHPWKIVPGRSVVCVDPNTDRDEIVSIKRVLGDVRIVRRERGDDSYSLETGVRWVQRALCDAYGDVRLRFWRGLQSTQFGALDGIMRYRRHPMTGQPVKDNLRDHPLDALRYVVSERLPVERAKPKVIGSAR